MKAYIILDNIQNNLILNNIVKNPGILNSYYNPEYSIYKRRLLREYEIIKCF